jgi:UDP-N-acetylglucosamine acyltransferase
MMSVTSIHPSACVDERAELGVGVTVEPGAVIGPHVKIGDRTRVGSCVLVTGWTRVGADCHLHHGAVVGSPPQDLKYSGEPSFLEVGDHCVNREYATMTLATEPEATTRVGHHCMFMAYSHVAHNCQLGDQVIIANAVQMAGYVTIEDWAIIGGATAIHQFVRIGCHSMVGGGTRVVQDVAPYIKLAGNPPRLAGLNGVGLERRGFSRATHDALAAAYKILFREQCTVTEAVARIRTEAHGVPEVEHFARFAETSSRGLTR